MANAWNTRVFQMATTGTLSSSGYTLKQPEHLRQFYNQMQHTIHAANPIDTTEGHRPDRLKF